MTWIKKGNLFREKWSQLPVIDNKTYPNSYKIYYSTRDKEGKSHPAFIIIEKKYMKPLFPPQLVNIPLGTPGSFDSHGIMPTDIVTLEDGTKYMYYIGWSKRIDVPYWNSLGLAISKDGGVTWEKYSEGPIFASNINDPNFMGTCCVIPGKKHECEWLMFYSSAHWEEIEGRQECVYDVKIARSNNGINWYHFGEKALYLLKNEGGIASPRIIKNRDYEYEMYFSVRSIQDYRTNPKKSYKIKKAYSNDLINWTRENNQSEFLVPEGDELMNAYPYIVQEQDRDLLFYNKDFGQGGIYHAEHIKK